MDVTLYLWKSEKGQWYLICESLPLVFMHMQPISNDTTVERLRARGVPLKVF